MGEKNGCHRLIFEVKKKKSYSDFSLVNAFLCLLGGWGTQGLYGYPSHLITIITIKHSPMSAVGFLTNYKKIGY